MPNLFDDLPEVAPSPQPTENLFADLPDLPREENLFADLEQRPLLPSEIDPADFDTYEKFKKRQQLQAEFNAVREGETTIPKVLTAIDLARGAARGGLKQTAAGLLRTAGATELAKGMSDLGREDIAEAKEGLAELGGGTGPAAMLTSTAIQSLPPLMAMPLGGIKGVATAAGLQTFGQVADEAYNTYLQAGDDEKTAHLKSLGPAAASGLITGLLTRYMPGGTEKLILKALRTAASKEVAKATVKEAVKRAVKEIPKQAALEFPEEFLDQIGQGLVAKYSYDPERTTEGILKEGLIAGLAGSALAGVFGSGVSTVDVGLAGAMARSRQSRLDQLRGQRRRTQGEREKRYETRSIVDTIMAAGQEGPNAQQNRTTEPVYEDVQRPTGPTEGPGQVPADEGSVGIPPRGQGPVQEEAQAIAQPAEIAAHIPEAVAPLPEPVPAPISPQEPIPPPEPAQPVQGAPSPVSAQARAIPEAAAPSVAPQAVELDTLVARRREITRKVLTNPVAPLPEEEMAELVAVSRRIHELDPTRAGRNLESQTQVVGSGVSDPALAEMTAKGSTVEDMLGALSKGTTPQATLARQLLKVADSRGRKVPVILRQGIPTSMYSADADQVYMAPQHAGDPVVNLHEAIHALTFAKLPMPLRMNYHDAARADMNPLEAYQLALDFVLVGGKFSKGEADANPHVIDLIKLYKDVVESFAQEKGMKATDIIGLLGDRAKADEMGARGVHYGLMDLAEFLTEAGSNAEFQSYLRNHDRKWWQKLVDIIRRLLGLDPSANTTLDKVLSLTTELAAAEREEGINIGRNIGEGRTLEAPSQPAINENTERSWDILTAFNGKSPKEALRALLDGGLISGGLRASLVRQLLNAPDPGGVLRVGGSRPDKPAMGSYKPTTREVLIYDAARDHNKPVKTLIHEYVHALTHGAIRGGQFKNELRALVDAAYSKMRREGLRFYGLEQYYAPDNEWGDIDTAEFLAEVFASKNLQEFLARTRTPKTIGEQIKTLWDWFIDILAKQFGIKQQSVLADAVRIGLEIAQNPGAQRITDEMPAAKVTDPSRRHDERVAVPEIPAAQGVEIDQSVHIQNYATIGSADKSFLALPNEVQSHLPAVRTRITAMYDAQAALGGRAARSDLATMIQNASTDPSTQQTFYWDTWQNVFDLLHDQSALAAKIETAKRELESEERKGGTAGNPTQDLISNATWHAINDLIAQRTAVIAAQGDPSPYNQRIEELKQWMHETPFYRVATAIANGQPLNFNTIGVNPARGALIAQIIQSYPGLQAGIAAIKAGPVQPNVAAMQADIASQEQALTWLDNLIGSREFQSNYRLAQEKVGAELDMVKETEADVKFTDPITGDKIAVTFSSEDGVIGEGQQKLYNWLQSAYTYLELPPEQRDPLTEAGVRLNIRVVEEVYLNPTFSPSRSGKIYVGTPTGRGVDPFNLLTLGGNLSTPEARIERSGGMEAGIAQMRLQAYGMAGQMLRTKYERMMNETYLKVVDAAASHANPGLLKRIWLTFRKKPIRKVKDKTVTSYKQWIEEISDPIIASWQETGSRHLTVGMKHLGRTITAEDMAAVEAQKKLHDSLSRLPSTVQTQMAGLFKLKIKVDDPFRPYFRDPQAQGKLTMPRYVRDVATTYARQWLGIRNDETDPVARNQKFIAYVGGRSTSQAFVDLIIGHMRSASDVPSYSRFIGSPFISQYRDMARAYHEGTATAPQNVIQVIDQLFQGQNVSPEKLKSREQIMDTLFGELSKAFNAHEPAKPTEHSQNEPATDVKVTSADNFLTTPRGEQILPSSLYEYSVADRNQHSRAQNAILEVMGQRFLESLQAWASTLSDTIKKFENQVMELERVGVPSTEAKAQVQAASRQAHLDGLNWYDYNEAIYQLSQAQKSIEEMQKIASTDRALENQELRSGTRVIRSVVGGLLEAVGVVWRNFLGGPLKMIQRDILMSKSIRIFRNSLNVTIPYGNLVLSPIRRFGAVPKTIVTGGILPGYLGEKFFSSPRGRAMRAQLEANPDAFSMFGQALLTFLNDRTKRYEQMRELGLAGGSPVFHQLEAYIKLFTTGGQVRKEGGSFGGGATSFFGGLAETGLFGGHPGIPRNAFSRFADLSVNAVVGSELDNTLSRLEEDALLYLSRRRGLGHSSSEMLTPEELVGSKYATQKEATHLRNQWQKAGLNVDRKMIEYWDKVQQAKNNQQPWENIRMLTDAEYNSLYMVYANEINKGGFMNRPAWLSTTELGRNFGFLMGYGLWDNSRFRLALSRFSKSKDKANAEGVATVFYWLLIAIPLAAILGESINKILTLWLYNEERQTPNPFRAESPWEAAKASVAWMAPFAPMVGNAISAIAGGTMKNGKVSFDLIPTSAAKSVIDTARAINQTGDVVRPVTAFVRQWAPNTRIALNRLPFNDGLTEYYNVNRTLRANTPSDIEVRQSAGAGSYRLSATSDNVQNVIQALNRPNGPDWELAMRERQLGIAAKAGGSTDPGVIARATRAFDASVKAKTPLQAVYGRKLGSDEISRIEGRLAPLQLSRLRRVNAAFDAYSQRTGSGIRRSRGRSQTRITGRRAGRVGRGRRIRSTGRLRGTRRLRGLRRSRGLRSSLR